MRLGFHYHTPAMLRDGVIMMPAYLGLFVDSIAGKCEELVCFQHSPVGNEMQLMDYKLVATNVTLVSLGPHASIPKRIVAAYRSRELYRRWQPRLDGMLVRASTPLLPVIASVWKKPLALLLVSDATAGLENLNQPGWRKLAIRAWARWYQSRQDKIARNCLTLVNSRLLYDQYRESVANLVETRTTTLSEADFHVRHDTCTGTPLRLLYAGRISRIKGLFEIVEALAVLVSEGMDVVLDLVGMDDPADPVLDRLVEHAEELGVPGRVRYFGYQTAGAGLLEYYRQADAYVIASQASSEGFPRTIWEAMASSLPVVATEVGSIPAFAGDAALLVPPKSPAKLTDALRRMLNDSALRQQLIRAGMKLARQNTLEQRADELLRHVQAWISRGQLAGDEGGPVAGGNRQ